MSLPALKIMLLRDLFSLWKYLESCVDISFAVIVTIQI